jgi:ABC-type antimicrobial peptide transport system permease subunit
MPDFPGIQKADSTRDWDAGFPLTYKIRPQDEAYWKQYRGTPKAFVTLAAGQTMWGNRFGDLTAIRFSASAGSPSAALRAEVEDKLIATIDPRAIGLSFEPVRAQALKAASQSQDFGQLFFGFSFFLVVSALLLMALLFQFGLEQRLPEVGLLLAVGWRPKQVRRLLLGEGAALAAIGGLVGMLGGIGYARAMMWGLSTIWRSAVGSSALQFRFTGLSLFIGAAAGMLVALFTLWLALRKQARQPARQLLAGEIHNAQGAGGRRWAWAAVGGTAAALAIVARALARGDTANAEAFFGAGALLLAAGFAAVGAWLARLRAQGHSHRLTMAGLGVRGCARRGKRSLATVALLACGAFLILAIGVFRLDANRDGGRRESGTGGFALIGQATLPIVHDLNTSAGRDFFGLTAADLEGVKVVPFRVHDGDDASCLNLNRAQKPRLLGVNPELLARRQAFTFQKTLRDTGPQNPWLLLDPWLIGVVGVAGSIQSPSIIDATIPAIGDANSIQWALGKKVGDTIDYTDEQGQPFKVRLVGAVANSILQGNLIIDEAAFQRLFPGESGYRMFLIEVPPDKAATVSATLSRALQDVGLELTPAVERLNAFNAVQNTYLGTFQVLGGLGLLLGSAGLGVVVLRNVLERRGELAVLLAVGFRRRALQRLVLSEHAVLLGLGLGIGSIAAVVAVLPAVLSPGAQLPYGSLGLTLGVVLLNGLVWTWMATRVALRGELLGALRNE